MPQYQIVEIALTPDEYSRPELLRHQAFQKAGWTDDGQTPLRILKRSLDARSKIPRFRLQAALGEYSAPLLRGFSPKLHKNAPQVLVVGAGPGGYFAALRLLEQGLCPILLERGADVSVRRKDIKRLYTDSFVNEHSNYCFGEGGAGTFSDGKLYTRATKRGDVQRVLELFVHFGASPDILVDAHPHLGSNALPRIVQALRAAIEAAGGEVHFNAHVVDILHKNGALRGVRLKDGQEYHAPALVLATGHSARDVYAMLQKANLTLRAKPFALGVRIEHPQPLIDQLMYRQSPRHAELPPASYRIATQTPTRGVFSFCMCPGGFIVPASTAPGELVLNGMSLASRKGGFANAGLVAEVYPQDLPEQDPFALLRFQKKVETHIFQAGDGSQKAPAQRAQDFLQGTLSASLKKSSYIPGIYSASLHELLPPFITKALQEGLHIFEKKFPDFAGQDATLLAVESRTSAPIRIPREKDSLMHPDLEGLFPCGEGAGYAGGIVSAALDGIACAEAAARYIQHP